MGLFDKNIGIKLNKHKNTVGMSVVPVSTPERVYIPLPDAEGSYCVPTVSKGSRVKMGQLIGKSKSKRLAPVHSSVSGTVEAVKAFPLPRGGSCMHIVIKTDGRQDMAEGLKAPVFEDREGFIEALRASGITESGEDCISIAESFDSPEGKFDLLVINATESEPYLTVEHMSMLAHASELIEGCRALMKNLGIPKTVIALEENKADAAKLLEEYARGAHENNGSNDIAIVILPENFPHTHHRTLFREAAKRELPPGKSPADIGIAVCGVSAVIKLEQYLEGGVPLITRSMTVDGNAVSRPMNIEAPTGTRLSDILSFCGGIKEGKTPGKLILGGPMNGIAIPDADFAVAKGFFGLVCFDEKYSKKGKETACIRCGRCMYACPEKLMPFMIAKSWENRKVERLESLNASACTGCGCCSYVCPARKPLSVEIFQAGTWLTVQKKMEEAAAKGGELQ